MKDPTEEPAKKYWAFISYSSKDKKWGKWLHCRLESYPIPKEFHDNELFDRAVLGKNLRPIFRDRDELSGSADLGPAIKNGLRQSRFLIVLCSPNSAKSKWVNQEIEDFKALDSQNHLRILALILDGEPNASSNPAFNAELECFPPALRLPVEPLAGDMRSDGDGKERGYLKILSGIAQLDFDTLYKRHARARKKKTFTRGLIAGAAVLFISLLSWVAVNRTREAKQTEYFNQLNQAGAYLKNGEAPAALERLLVTPPELRRAEWEILARDAGAPIGRFPAQSAAPEWFDVESTLSAEVGEMMKRLSSEIPAGEGEKSVPTSILARIATPDGRIVGYFPTMTGRSGADVVLMSGSMEATYLEKISQNESTEELFCRIQLDSYSSIASAALSADGSLLLVKTAAGTKIASISGTGGIPARPFPETKTLGDEKTKELPSEEDFLLIPLTHLLPEILAPGEIESFPGADLIAVRSLDHGLSSAQRNFLEELSIGGKRSGVESSTSPVWRIFRDLRQLPDRTLAVFQMIGTAHSFEVWDVSKRKLVSSFGENPPGRKLNETKSEFLDIFWPRLTAEGASFSRDGQFVVACPATELSDSYASDGYVIGDAAGVFSTDDGALVSILESGGGYVDSEGLSNRYAFDPTGTLTVQITQDHVVGDTTVHIHEVATGMELETSSRGVTDSRAFVGWNRDSSIVFEAFSDSYDLQISKYPSYEPVSSWSGGYKELEIFGLHDLYDFEADLEGRYRIGNLIFSDSSIQPVFTLPRFMGILDMSGPLLNSLRSTDSIESERPLTMADLYLSAYFSKKSER